MTVASQKSAEREITAFDLYIGRAGGCANHRLLIEARHVT